MLTKRSSQKKRKNNSLYESIMNDVSKVVKKHLNEMAAGVSQNSFNQFLNTEDKKWDFAVDYDDWTPSDQKQWVNDVLSDPDGKTYLLQLAFIDYISYYLGVDENDEDEILAEYTEACQNYPELEALTPDDWHGLNWGSVDENMGLDPDHYDLWGGIIKELIDGNNHFQPMYSSPILKITPPKTMPTGSTKVNSKQANNFWQQFQTEFGISEAQLISELDAIMGDSGESEDSSDSLYLLLDNLNWDINNFKKLSKTWYKKFREELINYYNEIPENEDEMDITQNLTNTYESFTAGRKYENIFGTIWGWWILFNLYGWSDTFGVAGGSGYSPARLKELIRLVK